MGSRKRPMVSITPIRRLTCGSDGSRWKGCRLDALDGQNHRSKGRAAEGFTANGTTTAPSPGDLFGQTVEFVAPVSRVSAGVSPTEAAATSSGGRLSRCWHAGDDTDDAQPVARRPQTVGGVVRCPTMSSSTAGPAGPRRATATATCSYTGSRGWRRLPTPRRSLGADLTRCAMKRNDFADGVDPGHALRLHPKTLADTVLGAAFRSLIWRSFSASPASVLTGAGRGRGLNRGSRPDHAAPQPAWPGRGRRQGLAAIAAGCASVVDQLLSAEKPRSIGIRKNARAIRRPPAAIPLPGGDHEM